MRRSGMRGDDSGGARDGAVVETETEKGTAAPAGVMDVGETLQEDRLGAPEQEGHGAGEAVQGRKLQVVGGGAACGHGSGSGAAGS
jgi:hypothetical protein